jgi:hypothetical protein
MVLIKILIFSILKLACANLEKVQHDFKVSKNQSIDNTASETCLTSSAYESSIITCVGSCNLNPDCVTVVFDQSKGKTINCFFYNRYFDSSEMIPSSASTVYEKKFGNYSKIN